MAQIDRYEQTGAAPEQGLLPELSSATEPSLDLEQEPSPGEAQAPPLFQVGAKVKVRDHGDPSWDFGEIRAITPEGTVLTKVGRFDEPGAYDEYELLPVVKYTHWYDSAEAYISHCNQAKLDYGFSLSGNFSVVTPYLVVSGRPNSSLLEKRFDQRSITHIINCIPAQEDQLLLDNYNEDDGTLLNLSIEDDSDDAQMAQGLHSAAEFVQRARAGNVEAIFFVHCMDGVNRAPAVGLAILMKLEGCSLVSAFDVMRAGRPCIRTKYIGVVAAFEQECRGVCSVPALLNGPIADSKSFCELYNNITKSEIKDDYQAH